MAAPHREESLCGAVTFDLVPYAARGCVRTLGAMPANASDDAPQEPSAKAGPSEEAARREADARALAESGLGSGLLARQSVSSDGQTVAVLKVCPQCGKEYETALRFCPNDGTALRPKGTDSLVGRVLADRYHILKPIGEGGMGRVYLGEHVKMNRQCAIKVMSPALVNDHESAARFAREASNAARIIHPNVAAVFDYGESDGVVYLVMEYVDGEPLSDLLVREAPFSVERALEITTQIAEGLSAAHELGIIHRDLKPDNILITRTRMGREVAKVVDFGIAKAVQESAGDALTRTGLVIGTPEFMSPEQLLGDPIDARSDLYALGCILHLMLTATPAFEATTREQMIKRRLSEDARPVHDLSPEIPIAVSMIVARLLARSSGERFGSAADVRDAINATHIRRSALGSIIPRALRPTPRSAPTVAFLHATQATTEVTVVPEPRRQATTPYVIGGVIAVLLAALVVVKVEQNAGTVASSGKPLQDSASSATSDNLTRALARLIPPGDSVRRRFDSTALATAPPPVVATTVVPAPVPAPDPAADSLKVVRLARQHERDSVARVANADTNIVRRKVVEYAKTVEARDFAKLRDKYPMMTDGLQRYWQAIFSDAAQLNVGVRYETTTLTSTSADVQFSLQVKVTKKSSESITLPRREQVMTMTRQGNRALVTQLR